MPVFACPRWPVPDSEGKTDWLFPFHSARSLPNPLCEPPDTSECAIGSTPFALAVSTSPTRWSTSSGTMRSSDGAGRLFLSPMTRADWACTGH